MSKNNQEPLDLEEVFPPEREVSITPLQRFVQNLEIIPLLGNILDQKKLEKVFKTFSLAKYSFL